MELLHRSHAHPVVPSRVGQVHQVVVQKSGQGGKNGGRKTEHYFEKGTRQIERRSENGRSKKLCMSNLIIIK